MRISCHDNHTKYITSISLLLSLFACVSLFLSLLFITRALFLSLSHPYLLRSLPLPPFLSNSASPLSYLDISIHLSPFTLVFYDIPGPFLHSLSPSLHFPSYPCFHLSHYPCLSLHSPRPLSSLHNKLSRSNTLNSSSTSRCHSRFYVETYKEMDQMSHQHYYEYILIMRYSKLTDRLIRINLMFITCFKSTSLFDYLGMR